MSRAGLPHARPEDWIPGLRSCLREAPIRLASVFTHLHSAESDDAATREQWNRYLRVLDALRDAGVDPGLRHVANSAGILRHSFLRADVVRPGFYLYGGAPGAPAGSPVVSVRARILDVREVEAGRTVGYGATHRTERPARLATVGIGYGDGLRRELADGGAVLVRGRRAPIRGSVCMDVVVVDLTGFPPVDPGERVTVLGADDDGRIELEEMARLCGTIGYEILTGWSARLPRLTTPSEAREPDAPAGSADRDPHGEERPLEARS